MMLLLFVLLNTTSIILASALIGLFTMLFFRKRDKRIKNLNKEIARLEKLAKKNDKK